MDVMFKKYFKIQGSDMVVLKGGVPYEIKYYYFIVVIFKSLNTLGFKYASVRWIQL